MSLGYIIKVVIKQGHSRLATFDAEEDRGVRFGHKVGQITPRRDQSGTLLDQRFAELKCTEI